MTAVLPGLISGRALLKKKKKCTYTNYTGVTNITTTDTGPPNLWIFPGQLNGCTVEHSTIKGP
jgi:hypothetical protein